MSLCSIVKVDVTDRDDEELAAVLEAPRVQGALLVATGVGDHACFQRLQGKGFTYFQGDYFAKPRLFRHRGVATAGLGSLRRLGELTAGDVSFEDLERIIASDVGLSLKLLRYVNSAFFALPRTVGSVREALSLLGVRTVRRWATVMAISAIPDVPDELVALGLRRARMCEMLAGSALPEERETLFTIGLFSVADALLDAPMAEVLDSLPFTDEIQVALLRREGPKGELLAAVTAYERGEFPHARDRRRRCLAGRRLPRRARVGRRSRPRDRLVGFVVTTSTVAVPGVRGAVPASRSSRAVEPGASSSGWSRSSRSK